MRALSVRSVFSDECTAYYSEKILREFWQNIPSKALSPGDVNGIKVCIMCEAYDFMNC